MAISVGAHLGDSVLWVAVGLLAYALSGATGRKITLWTACMLLAAGALVWALKFLVRRQRPDASAGRFSLYYGFDAYAFPSGHACRVFAAAILLGSLYPAWLIPLLCLAFWVGLSRVMLGVHHLSDVLVGAAIGCAVGVVTQWLLVAH